MAHKPDPSKFAGDAGMAAPPPGAPYAVADNSPAAINATADQVRQARASEQELAPLVPTPMTDEQIYAFLGKRKEDIVLRTGDEVLPAPAITATQPSAGAAPVAERQLVDPSGNPVSSADGISLAKDIPETTSSLRPPGGGNPRRLRPAVGKPPVAVVPVETAPVAVPAASPDVVADGTDIPQQPIDQPSPDSSLAAAVAAKQQDRQVNPNEPYRPAASDTDSPSRGLPTFNPDQGKQITGGFGNAIDAQYIPLNGRELGELVKGLLSQIDARIDDDLRFQESAVYPRVNARVVVEVQCFGEDRSFQIPKTMIPWTKTPLAVARAYAEEITFVVMAERDEVNADGSPATAPNQTRQDLGLPIPRKQAVQTPGGRQIVDVLS